MIEFDDFQSHGPVPADVTQEFRGRVPDDLVEVWEHYGYGSFADGFFRLVDPRLHSEALKDCIGKTQGDGVAIPVMTTGLGDLITWEPSHSAFIGIQYRNGNTKAAGPNVAAIVKFARGPQKLFMSKFFDWDLYPAAVEAYGPLAHDESFTFVPLPSLGGAKKVENLKKRQTISAIEMMVEMQGVIGH